jgi:hypothetical protein
MDSKEILLKILDEQGVKSLIIDDVLDGIVKAKLDELVLDTENTLDDSLVEMIYPMVKAAVSDWLQSQIDELNPPPAA